ncbi:unnamed protein product [Closterium sp. Yama58-4]|nr:unnamed protein product [Closterium sp. Yama58-4]
MAEIREFGLQMQGWDMRHMQDYDDITHEYHELKAEVVRERNELNQLRTAVSTSVAEARAVAADAGRAAAAAAVGALQEKLEGFFENLGVKLKSVVEQVIERSSLEATITSSSMEHLQAAIDNSVYTVWKDLRTADDQNNLTFTKIQKALSGLSTKLKGLTGPIKVRKPPTAGAEATPRPSRTQPEADSPDIPISAAQRVMERFAATSEGEAGETGAGVADIDLSEPVRRNWRETYAAKKVQKEKEKESVERRTAEARKRQALQTAQAAAAKKRRAESGLGNTRVEDRPGTVSSGRVTENQPAGTAAEARMVEREKEDKRRREEQKREEARKVEREKEEKRQKEEEERKREEARKAEREKEENWQKEEARKAGREKEKRQKEERKKEEKAEREKEENRQEEERKKEQARKAEREKEEKRQKEEEERKREEARKAEREKEEKRQKEEEERKREEARKAEREKEEKRQKEEEERKREEARKAEREKEEKRQKEEEERKREEARKAEREKEEKRQKEEEERKREEARKAEREKEEKRQKEEEERKREEARKAEREKEEKRQKEEEERKREEARKAEREKEEKRQKEEEERKREEARKAEREKEEKRQKEERKREEARKAEREKEEKRQEEEEERKREEARKAEREKEEKRQKEEARAMERRRAQREAELEAKRQQIAKFAETKRLEAAKRKRDLEIERRKAMEEIERIARLEEAAKEEEERQQKELEAETEKMENERRRIAVVDLVEERQGSVQLTGHGVLETQPPSKRPRIDQAGTNFDADEGSLGTAASDECVGENVSGNQNVQPTLGEATGEVAPRRTDALPDELGKRWGETRHFRSSGLTTREKKNKKGEVVSVRFNSEQTVGGVKRNMGSYKERKLRDFTVAVCWMTYFPDTDMPHYGLDPAELGLWAVHLDFARDLPTGVWSVMNELNLDKFENFENVMNKTHSRMKDGAHFQVAVCTGIGQALVHGGSGLVSPPANVTPAVYAAGVAATLYTLWCASIGIPHQDWAEGADEAARGTLNEASLASRATSTARLGVWT